MSAAAVTPNVKGILVCDDVFGSDIEENVMDLEGVRHVIAEPSFPCGPRIFLFLHLECARAGTFNGNIRFVHDETGREARRRHFMVMFRERGENISQAWLLEDCLFRRPVVYNIEVWFWASEGREVLKGERSFRLIEERP
jgi:hypothetical protein